MGKRKYRYFVGDFETTVYKGQKSTEVWASASVELYTEDVQIFHSIDEQFDYFVSLNSNIICYYHNLKFDGNFWLYYFLNKKGYAHASIDREDGGVEWLEDYEMKNNTIKYGISDMGNWYYITLKIHDKYIEFRDSMKLLPFSVKRIGESFQTKHKKLNMEYEGFRYAGCEITPEEKKYIANDVLVIKEAMEIMFDEGHTKLTIGSCCLSEFTKIIHKDIYKEQFPQLYDIPLDVDIFKARNAGEYIRHAYKGGWCYLVKGKENQIKHNGITLDVNSLYPSMMSSESGNRYPIGLPTFWRGNFIPKEVYEHERYFFIRIKTRFYIKHNHLPFIQIKNNLMYRGNECLMTSDILNRDTGEYSAKYINLDGELTDARPTLTLTMTDFRLLQDQYNLVDCEILDGCWFETTKGVFDLYINKYKQIKMTSTGARRELAKLFLNNLYGKMAANTNSSFKVAYTGADGALSFKGIAENNKTAGYIAIGAAITSYARNFTIRAAQANYYGADRRGFIYADTDSIHCDLPIEKIKGVKIDSTNFCCWKHESTWETGLFVRQKTYIEIENGKMDIKCAGMPEKCKELFRLSVEQKGDKMTDEEKEFISRLNETEKEWVKQKRELTDFKVGLCVPGKLLPKRIVGGVLLTDTTYEMRDF